LEEVSRLISDGKPVTDTALLKRIHERAEEVRRAMLEKHGMTNIAVDLIREVRAQSLFGSPLAQQRIPASGYIE